MMRPARRNMARTTDTEARVDGTAAAGIGGCDAPAEEPAAPSAFRYANRLGREYEDSLAVVKSVSFPVSRRLLHERTIEFATPVTEKTAIEAAEAYLSRPLTRKFWSKVWLDSRPTEHSPRAMVDSWWEESLERFETRGDAMRGAESDVVFLDCLSVSCNDRHVSKKVGLLLSVSVGRGRAGPAHCSRRRTTSP